MRRILVTGANKGIGYAIAEAILTEHADTYVYLGARSAERGRRAAETLARRPGVAERVQSIELDVSSDESVSRAAREITAPLYAVVNNAGIMTDNVRDTLTVNFHGVRRVCEAFLPRLQPEGGRIVNVTSAAGPMFVSQCSRERQKFFVDPNVEWSELQAFAEQCWKLAEDKQALKAEGLGELDAYGLSKAFANSYTQWLARKHPKLHINACTPGFIDTDLSRPFVQQSGKSGKEMGMKTPAEGARSTVHLLFGALQGNGHYYGSDAQRSPLDRYRAPGDPPYTGLT